METIVVVVESGNEILAGLAAQMWRARQGMWVADFKVWNGMVKSGVLCAGVIFQPGSAEHRLCQPAHRIRRHQEASARCGVGALSIQPAGPS